MARVRLKGKPYRFYGAINHPQRIGRKFTGAGYHLDLAHPDLPEDRTVCGTWNVVGVYQEHKVGFVVFLENHTLTFECFDYDGYGVPPEIRNGTVEVSATQCPISQALSVDHCHRSKRHLTKALERARIAG